MSEIHVTVPSVTRSAVSTRVDVSAADPAYDDGMMTSNTEGN